MAVKGIQKFQEIDWTVLGYTLTQEITDTYGTESIIFKLRDPTIVSEPGTKSITVGYDFEFQNGSCAWIEQVMANDRGIEYNATPRRGACVLGAFDSLSKAISQLTMCSPRHTAQRKADAEELANMVREKTQTEVHALQALIGTNDIVDAAIRSFGWETKRDADRLVSGLRNVIERVTIIADRFEEMGWIGANELGHQAQNLADAAEIAGRIHARNEFANNLYPLFRKEES